MIQPQELRLGSIISFQGHMNYILSIHSPAPDTSKRFDGNFVVEINPPDSFNVPIDEIEPIPLTEEWLIRFGFDNFPNQFRNKNYINKISIVIEENVCLFKGAYDEFNITIQFVHQLQNLYWCLCGEELKISL